jgi:hypothetical protein
MITVHAGDARLGSTGAAESSGGGDCCASVAPPCTSHGPFHFQAVLADCMVPGIFFRENSSFIACVICVCSCNDSARGWDAMESGMTSRWTCCCQVAPL